MKDAHWCGGGLDSIPNESSFGYFHRLCWLNAVGMQAAMRLLDAPNFPTRTQTFFGKLKRIRHVIERVNFNSTRFPEERSLVAGEVSNLLGAIFTSRLRFCPVCLESGYHSIWFQCSKLARCPIHNVDIHDRCMKCSSLLSDIGILENFREALHCPVCHCALSGAPLSPGVFVESYLHEHRTHVKIYRQAFSTLNEWVEDVSARGDSWIAYSNVEIWAADAECAFAIACALAKPPEILERPSCNGVALFWQRHLAGNMSFVPLFTIRRREDELIRVVYCCTLRLLRSYAAGIASSGRVPLKQFVVFRKGDGIQVSTGDARVQAYMLLRYFVEQPANSVIALDSAVEQVSPSRDLGWFLSRDENSRASTRAGILLAYATMHRAIREAATSGFVKWDRLIELVQGVVMAHQYSETVERGVVVFRMPVGMPLAPFRPLPNLPRISA